jgi:hypothetical protein
MGRSSAGNSEITSTAGFGHDDLLLDPGGGEAVGAGQ